LASPPLRQRGDLSSAGRDWQPAGEGPSLCVTVFRRFCPFEDERRSIQAETFRLASKVAAKTGNLVCFFKRTLSFLRKQTAEGSIFVDLLTFGLNARMSKCDKWLRICRRHFVTRFIDPHPLEMKRVLVLRKAFWRNESSFS